MTCQALFYDGPLAGRVREFDRDEPPPKFYAEQPGELVRDKTGCTTLKLLCYVRDIDPFGNDGEWIYLLKESDEG